MVYFFHLLGDRDIELILCIITIYLICCTDSGKYINGIRKNNIKEWQKNETEGDSLYILDDSGNKLEIHFSTIKERIKYGKKHYDKETQWFV